MAENNKVIVVNTKGDTNSNATLRMKIQDNFYALTPILKFENCVGIFRFYLKDGELQPPNWAMKSYSAFLAIAYMTVFCIFLKLPAAIIAQENIVDIIEEVPSFVILFNYTTAMITTSFFLSKCNMDVILIIAELDNHLMKIKDDKFYEKNRSKNIKFLLFLCLSQSLIIALDIVTQYIAHDFSTISSLIVFPVYLIQKLEILVFCIFIGMLVNRLFMINGYLAKFIEEKESSKTPVFTLSDKTVQVKEVNNVIGRPAETNMKIRDLAMMYEKLGVICSLINEIYNLQIFMTLVSTFVYIVITIWTSLYYFKSTENESGPLINVSIWCLTAILIVGVMCYVCERLRFVRNSTKILVNQIIMDYDLPKTMRVQAKAFMELIEAWPLSIYIYDMFSVDITLMLKFLSVATTYLIVIIQISHYT